jgi:hypothetical protein
MGATDADDALVVPSGITMTPLPGGAGVLEMTALTLEAGANGPVFYVSLKNIGDTPACDGAVQVQLYDKAQQPLGAGLGGLASKDFYRVNDGSGSLTACIGPGSVTMASVTELPSDLVIEDVGFAVYNCMYFVLDVSPISGLKVEGVQTVGVSDGTAYTGTVTNGLEVAVTNPSVTIFPVNRVGRPLDMATASGSDEVPPAGSWAFQTSAVQSAGSDYAAFPSGTPAQ